MKTFHVQESSILSTLLLTKHPLTITFLPPCWQASSIPPVFEWLNVLFWNGLSSLSVCCLLPIFIFSFYEVNSFDDVDTMALLLLFNKAARWQPVKCWLLNLELKPRRTGGGFGWDFVVWLQHCCDLSSCSIVHHICWSFHVLTLKRKIDMFQEKVIGLWLYIWLVWLYI